MTRPLIVQPEVMTSNPSAPVPAPDPFKTTSGVPENPGCVVPSITTAYVIGGRADKGVIVCDPVPTANLMVYVPDPGYASALRIAWRRDPGPVSSELVTV